MSDKNKSPNFYTTGRKLKKDLSRYASRAGVRFFKARFREQAWLDTAKEPWPQRASDAGRAILIGRGYLRDSIRVVARDDSRIVFGTDVPYAQIHNEGGTIQVKVTARSRKFFWFMYYRTGDSIWKGMALTAKTHLNVTIPKRQFMGHSETLMGELDDWLEKQIEKRFKQAVNNA